MLQFISENVVYETVSAKPEAVHFHDALIAKSLAAASPIVYGVVSDATDDELDEIIGDGVAEIPDASVDEVVHPSCRQVGGFGFPDLPSASMDAGAIHDSKTLTLAVASGHAESVESSDDNCSKEELMAQLEEARVNHQRLKLCCQMLIVSDDTKNGQTGSFQTKLDPLKKDLVLARECLRDAKSKVHWYFEVLMMVKSSVSLNEETGQSERSQERETKFDRDLRSFARANQRLLDEATLFRLHTSSKLRHSFALDDPKDLEFERLTKAAYDICVQRNKAADVEKMISEIDARMSENQFRRAQLVEQQLAVDELESKVSELEVGIAAEKKNASMNLLITKSKTALAEVSRLETRLGIAAQVKEASVPRVQESQKSSEVDPSQMSRIHEDQFYKIAMKMKAARTRSADDAGLHAGESEPKKVCRPPGSTVSIVQQIRIDRNRQEAIARKEKRKLDAMRVQQQA